MFQGTHRTVLTNVCQFVLLVITLSVLGAGVAQAQAHVTSGGFMDSASANGLRSRMSAAQIQSMLPAARGEFTFPSPYNTTGVRLTNASDCGGQDCVNYIGYSYWNNINNHVGSDTMLIFLGLDRSRGGAGPSLFSYNKNTGATQNLGPLFSADSPYSWSTGEGWYFSATQPTTLYVVLAGSTSLQRYDVTTHAMTTVFDVNSRPDVLGSNRKIWQVHSSNDDRVHSFTLKDSGYADLGCGVYREDTNQVFFYPQKGLNYDECAIDKSGRWLVIKDKLGIDPNSEVDNRIIDLQTGSEQILLDKDGAGGHSDMGYGYMIAEDNMYPQPGAARLWHFGQDLKAAGQGTLVYQLEPGNWQAVAGLGHVSHSNARPDLPSSQQTACVSSAERKDLPRVNEISCFKLDGSLTTLVVAPNMVDLDASGGGSDDYSKRPKGNLDVTGEFFVWSANAAGGRDDVFIVRIPQSKLGGTTAPAPPSTSNPTPTPTPTPVPPTANTPAPGVPSTPSPAPPVVDLPVSGSALGWSMLVNVAANGNTLQKNGGCSGCPDAGAVSVQQITSGALEFTASDAGSLSFIGLSTNQGIDPSAIAFAVRLQNGVAEVRESGSYKSEISFGGGDTFRISVNGGTVTYAKNGSVYYTSANRASSAMVVNATFFDSGATIANIALSGAGASAAAPAPSTPAPAAPIATVPATPTPAPTTGNGQSRNRFPVRR